MDAEYDTRRIGFAFNMQKQSGKTTGIVHAISTRKDKNDRKIRVTCKDEVARNSMMKQLEGVLLVEIDYYDNPTYDLDKEFNIEMYDDWNYPNKEMRNEILSKRCHHNKSCVGIYVYTCDPELSNSMLIPSL